MTDLLTTGLLKNFLNSPGMSRGDLSLINRPVSSSPGLLFQDEGSSSAFDMEIIFHSHANKTHFHKRGCAPSLILKVRVFGTRKWPIEVDLFRRVDTVS